MLDASMTILKMSWSGGTVISNASENTVSENA